MSKSKLALSLFLCFLGMSYGLLEGRQKGPYMAAFGKDPNSQFPSVQAGVIVADEQYTSEANNPTGLYTNTLRFSDDHGATWKYPVYPTDNGTYNDCGPETTTAIRGDVYAVKYLGSANEGNNIFISLATSGIICTSTTGSLWLMASPSKESGYNDEYRPLYDVTYGNGTFVAVGGDGLVKYSLTGSAEGAWKNITVGDLNLNSVTFANGKFVAAGDHSTVWYSPDGINWTQAQLSGEADFYKIIFVPEANQGAGQFIAVASEGTIWYSPDGVLWTIATVVNGGETTFVDVAYGQGTYVAIGDDNTASYSIAAPNEPLGTVWHTNSSAFLIKGNSTIVTHPHAIIYDNNPVSQQFIVVTTDEDPGLQTGHIYYSSDGVTWSTATIYDPTGKFFLDASYLATVITTDQGLLAISDGSGTDLIDAPVNVMDSLYESGSVGSNWTALCGFNGGQC